MGVDELYQDLILDHYRHPRCQGSLQNPDARYELYNPLCGDEITVELKSDGALIQDIVFSGSGCSLSQASASMMSDICKGKTVSEVRGLFTIFQKLMQGTATESEVEQLGDAQALEGVRAFAARIRCVVLGWEAIMKCLDKVSPEASDTQEL